MVELGKQVCDPPVARLVYLFFELCSMMLEIIPCEIFGASVSKLLMADEKDGIAPAASQSFVQCAIMIGRR